jgi:hypothetical protein
LRIALDGYSIKTIDNYLGIYRVHEGNSISQPGVYLRSMVVLLKTHFSLSQNSYLRVRTRNRRVADLYAEVASMELTAARFWSGIKLTFSSYKLSSRPRKEMLLPIVGVKNLVGNFLFGVVKKTKRKN